MENFRCGGVGGDESLAPLLIPHPTATATAAAAAVGSGSHFLPAALTTIQAPSTPIALQCTPITATTGLLRVTELVAARRLLPPTNNLRHGTNVDSAALPPGFPLRGVLHPVVFVRRPESPPFHRLRLPASCPRCTFSKCSAVTAITAIAAIAAIAAAIAAAAPLAVAFVTVNAVAPTTAVTAATATTDAVAAVFIIIMARSFALTKHESPRNVFQSTTPSIQLGS